MSDDRFTIHPSCAQCMSRCRSQRDGNDPEGRIYRSLYPHVISDAAWHPRFSCPRQATCATQRRRFPFLQRSNWMVGSCALWRHSSRSLILLNTRMPVHQCACLTDFLFVWYAVCTWAASTLLPLATITVPESCGDFVFTQLVGCGGELIIEEGCCDQSCKDIFALVGTGWDFIYWYTCFAMYCNVRILDSNLPVTTIVAMMLATHYPDSPFRQRRNDPYECASELDQNQEESGESRRSWYYLVKITHGHHHRKTFWRNL